jgi:siderophore synthetase component
MELTLDTTIADTTTSHALLNCLMREISGPEGQVTIAGPYVLVRLARLDTRLRARLRAPVVEPAPRLEGPVEELREGGWEALGWERLVDLVAGELELATGVANDELRGRVGDSHAAIEALLEARSGRRPPDDPYLESEQSLVAGHRFHPTPKARSGAPSTWLAYAPEAYTRFPLRRLAVRQDLLREERANGGQPFEPLDAAVPDGYRALPAHPWQLALLGEHPSLRDAFADGRVVDLGPSDRSWVPTSSVRTVYDPAADVFYKFSLDVRITNCVRKNAWYELTGAIGLTRLLRGVFAEVGRAVLLAEPAYRTVDLGDRRLYEGLAVIVREGVRRRLAPGLTPLLAAAIAAEESASSRFLRLGGHALEWWWAYVSVVAPPVLHAFFRHGVVLEPHLQNVVIGVTADGMPAQAIFRDLEGTKLVGDRHGATLAGLPTRVREALTYDAERGWNRVLYCLVVNHLAEVAAAVATARPSIAGDLWPLARERFTAEARSLGWPPPIRALLAGVPLPAKANLRTRWARSADRQATYVPVVNPLGDAGTVAQLEPPAAPARA